MYICISICTLQLYISSACNFMCIHKNRCIDTVQIDISFMQTCRYARVWLFTTYLNMQIVRYINVWILYICGYLRCMKLKSFLQKLSFLLLKLLREMTTDDAQTVIESAFTSMKGRRELCDIPYAWCCQESCPNTMQPLGQDCEWLGNTEASQRRSESACRQWKLSKSNVLFPESEAPSRKHIEGFCGSGLFFPEVDHDIAPEAGSQTS